MHKADCEYKKACEKDCTNSNHNKSSNVGDCMPCISAKKMKLQGNLLDNVKGNDSYFLPTCQLFSVAGYR